MMINVKYKESPENFEIEKQKKTLLVTSSKFKQVNFYSK